MANSFSGKYREEKQLYINDFVAVFGRFPEGWTPKRQQEVPELENSFLQRLVLIESPQLCKIVHFLRFLLS